MAPLEIISSDIKKQLAMYSKYVFLPEFKYSKKKHNTVKLFKLVATTITVGMPNSTSLNPVKIGTPL
jgi:hypothetical protein